MDAVWRAMEDAGFDMAPPPPPCEYVRVRSCIACEAGEWQGHSHCTPGGQWLPVCDVPVGDAHTLVAGAGGGGGDGSSDEEEEEEEEGEEGCNFCRL